MSAIPTALHHPAADPFDALDVGAARAFLRRLDPDAQRVTLQTFDDTDAKRKSLARVHHVQIDGPWPDAMRGFNVQRAGIFACVNETDGRGRKAHNVVRVRAVVADLDGAPLDPVLDAGLDPHIVVESSPGRWHAYWRVSDCQLDQFERVQQAIARRFNGDPAVSDLPRVMRLPGFLHQKGEPFQTKMIGGHDGEPYTLAEIVGGLGLTFDEPPRVNGHTKTDDIIGEGSRNATLFAFGRRLHAQGKSNAEIDAAMRRENATRCNPPLPEGELVGLVRNVQTAKDDPAWKAAGGATSDAPHDNVGGAPDEAGGGATVNPWPAPLDLVALAARDPVPPRHVIGDWLPAGEVTLLAGHGGGGKSGLALYVAACVALGREPWPGAVVERRRVYYISAEDRADILDCRLVRIARHLGVPLGLLAGHLNVIDASGLDAELVIESNHEAVLTNMYRTLHDAVPRDALIVLDGASDLYGASEIVRRHVRFYIRTLRRLVGPEGAVLLLAHVDKGAARDSTTTDRYSGSTAWHNSVRARWSLAGDATKGELVLTLAKANHAKPGAEIPWSWDAAGHLYVPGSAPGGGIVEAIRDRAEQAGIVRALIDAAAAGISVPSATNGRRTAFHVLSAQPSFPDSLRSGAPEIRRFWGHVEALRAMGHVADSTIARADRHRVAVLIVTQEGMRACGQ